MKTKVTAIYSHHLPLFLYKEKHFHLLFFPFSSIKKEKTLTFIHFSIKFLLKNIHFSNILLLYFPNRIKIFPNRRVYLEKERLLSSPFFLLLFFYKRKEKKKTFTFLLLLLFIFLFKKRETNYFLFYFFFSLREKGRGKAMEVAGGRKISMNMRHCETPPSPFLQSFILFSKF